MYLTSYSCLICTTSPWSNRMMTYSHKLGLGKVCDAPSQKLTKREIRDCKSAHWSLFWTQKRNFALWQRLCNSPLAGWHGNSNLIQEVCWFHSTRAHLWREVLGKSVTKLKMTLFEGIYLKIFFKVCLGGGWGLVRNKVLICEVPSLIAY